MKLSSLQMFKLLTIQCDTDVYCSIARCVFSSARVFQSRITSVPLAICAITSNSWPPRQHSSSSSSSSQAAQRTMMLMTCLSTSVQWTRTRAQRSSSCMSGCVAANRRTYVMLLLLTLQRRCVAATSVDRASMLLIYCVFDLWSGNSAEAQAELSLHATSSDVLHKASEAGADVHEPAHLHVPRRGVAVWDGSCETPRQTAGKPHATSLCLCPPPSLSLSHIHAKGCSCAHCCAYVAYHWTVFQTPENDTRFSQSIHEVLGYRGAVLWHSTCCTCSLYKSLYPMYPICSCSLNSSSCLKMFVSGPLLQVGRCTSTALCGTFALVWIIWCYLRPGSLPIASLVSSTQQASTSKTSTSTSCPSTSTSTSTWQASTSTSTSTELILSTSH